MADNPQFTKEQMRRVNNFLFTLEPNERQDVLQSFSDLDVNDQSTVINNILDMEAKSDIQRPLSQAEAIQSAPSAPERFLNNIQANLGPIGQFAGSLGGAAIGSRAGRPILGEFLGGSAGSITGESAEELLRTVRGQPNAFTSQEARDKFLKDIAIGVGTEAAIGVPLQLGRQIFKNVGKNVGRAILGDEVFDRGLERGFKKIMDTADIPGDLSPNLTKRIKEFFPRLRSVAGSSVEKTIKDNNVSKSTKPIKQTVANLLKETDIDDLEISGAAKKDLKRAFDIVKDLSDEDELLNIWKSRRKFDDIVYKRKIKDDDTLRIITEARNAFNAPLTKTSTEIRKAFRNYSGVIQSQEALGTSFSTRPLVGGQEDEVVADKAESFARSLFSGNKEQIIKEIRNLETILDADDKVLEDLLDLAAAEKLTKSQAGGGVVDAFGRIAFATFGGKRAVASIGAGLQYPIGRGVRAGLAAGLSGIPAVSAASLKPRDQFLQPKDVLPIGP